MASGVPVISSNVTSLPEVLGESALYFSPDKPQELADQLVKIIKDDLLKNRLIESGFKQAENYSWEQTAKNTLEIYKKFDNK